MLRRSGPRCESTTAKALTRRKTATGAAVQNGPMAKTPLRPVLALLALLAAPLPVLAQPRGTPMPGEFVVVDGRVDAGTYAGWKLFHTACYVCHGVCAVQRRRFPAGAIPARQPLQPEATGATMEVTKWLKPSGKRATNWWQRECAGRNASER